jgi:hypothetical protein
MNKQINKYVHFIVKKKKERTGSTKLQEKKKQESGE